MAQQIPPGYRMVARSNGAEIVLYGPIGSYFVDGIGAAQFRADLKKLGAVDRIDLRINSDGGDVFEGRAIHASLSEHPARIVVHVDGLAASIASLIAMAGAEIRMADGAFMMIHNPWGVAVGEAAELRQRADLLDSVAATMRSTYAARTRGNEKDIERMMNDETWLSAKDAKARGFADVVAEPMRMAAAVRDLTTADGRRIEAASRFRNVPAALRPRMAALQTRLAAIRG